MGFRFGRVFKIRRPLRTLQRAVTAVSTGGASELVGGRLRSQLTQTFAGSTAIQAAKTAFLPKLSPFSTAAGFPMNDAGRNPFFNVSNPLKNPYQSYRDILTAKRKLAPPMIEKLPGGRLVPDPAFSGGGKIMSGGALIIAGGRVLARQVAAKYGTTVRGLYAAIKQFGPVAAAAALGITGEQMLQLLASKPHRRTRAGISTRDMRVTRRTVRKLVRFTHDIRALGSGTHHRAAPRFGGTRVLNVK